MTATIDPAVEAALAAVRQDGSGINWALAGYESNTAIGLIGQGSGGVEVQTVVLHGILSKRMP